MWQPGWEGSLGENGYIYMYGWVPLLLIGYSPKQNKKLKKKKKTAGTFGSVTPIIQVTYSQCILYLIYSQQKQTLLYELWAKLAILF